MLGCRSPVIRDVSYYEKGGLFYSLPAFFCRRPYTGASVMVGCWERKASSALLAS
jgi:hypothetical protein